MDELIVYMQNKVVVYHRGRLKPEIHRRGSVEFDVLYDNHLWTLEGIRDRGR